MKKVVIVNCFDTYEDRVDLLYNFFSSKGNEVTIIQSDFRHFKKVHRIESKQDFIFLKSEPYYKNMSVSRLKSHYRFAKDAFKLVDKIGPDMLYVLVPPNSLVKFASEYKKKYKNISLIFDLIDLWPETMPVGKVKKIPPFTFWRFLRDGGIKYADLVVTECNLYQQILDNVLKDSRKETLYLAKENINTESNPKLLKDEIHLGYLGSINNIIDIPKIKVLIKAINDIKPTTLHIIGDGESKDQFIKEVEAVGAIVKYHGKVYDPQQKQDIFDKCHFGLNIMKDSVCVGLTMKSVDYFQHGLPIINNIQADTSKFVEKYKIGFNVTDESISKVAYRVANTEIEKYAEMKKNISELFNNYFSVSAFENKLDIIIRNLK